MNRLKAFFLAHLVLVLYTINIFECTLYVRKARDIYILFIFFQFGFFFVILRQPETTLYTYIFLMRSFIGGAIHLYGNDSFTLRSHSEI